MIGHASLIGSTAALAVGLTLAAWGNASSGMATRSARTVVVSEAGTQPAGPPLPWTPSEVVANPADGEPLVVGNGDQLVVGADRTAAVWTTMFRDGKVHTRSRTHAGTWGPTRRLGRGYDAQVAGNQAGLLVATWSQERADGYRIMTARRPAGGAWTRAQVLRTLPGQRDTIDLEVDVAGNGIAAVSWVEGIEQRDPPDPSWAYIAKSTPTGEWKRPELLVDKTWFYPSTSSAIDTDGRIAVVYPRRKGLMYREHPPGGSWTPARRIGAGGQVDPLLMMSGADDTEVVAWTTFKAFRAVRRSGGTWAKPLTWADPGREWSSDAAMDAAGDVTFGWIGPKNTLWTRSWPAGESLTESLELLPPVEAGSFSFRFHPKVAAGPEGHVLVAVQTFDKGVTTFVRAPGGDWQTGRLPQRAGQMVPSAYQVAAGTGGRFAATWAATRGLRLSTLTPE